METIEFPNLQWIAEGVSPELDLSDRAELTPEERKQDFDNKWISAHAASVIMTKASGSRGLGLQYLTEALRGGAVWARGVVCDPDMRRAVQVGLGLPENDDFQRIPIDRIFWETATSADEARWNWLTSEFYTGAPESNKSIGYFDVQLASFEIIGLCEDFGLNIPDGLEASPPISAAPKRNFGGRNNDKHGKPIARFTIKLLNMGDEFNRYKGESAAQDLAAEYDAIEVQRPSEKNLLGIARGILHAVREARGEP